MLNGVSLDGYCFSDSNLAQSRLIDKYTGFFGSDTFYFAYPSPNRNWSNVHITVFKNVNNSWQQVANIDYWAPYSLCDTELNPTTSSDIKALTNVIQSSTLKVQDAFGTATPDQYQAMSRDGVQNSAP